jgi:hypothetical protein
MSIYTSALLRGSGKGTVFDASAEAILQKNNAAFLRESRNGAVEYHGAESTVSERP